ncbi:MULTISPECIES: MarR family transcriptional regulator [Streptomyces]|uniref:MarR family winged helix-turn-helix transcriptional regulator n=1 Tax=Streptomyces TaxID=1883 RepID=UPI001577756F|nr:MULTISPECIES: MarR family transcriptional regulator [Streptomyces]
MPSADTPLSSLPADDPIGLQSFAVLLRRMNAEFNRIVQEFAQAHGLHLTDVQALIAVLDAEHDEEGGPMTPGRLRSRMNLTSGAVTACLDRLEKAGHVRRVRAADDRRVVHIHYAPSGREAAREFFGPLARGTEAACAPFDPAELHVVVRFLQAMNHQLGLVGR